MVNQPASDVKLAQKSNHKLLKGQIREISQQLRLTLASADEPQKREQGDVVALMESADNFFRQRGIVFNIECFEKKIAGKMEMIVQLDCHYGLKERINNLNSFLDFCAIHGFMPMIDKIIIKGKEVSQIKELYSLFSFALFEKDPLIANIMVNEIEKLEDSLQKPMKDILHYIHSITEYTTKTYQYLLGNHAQKLRNEGVVSESIFAELTLRLENEIRKQVGIASSYMKLANYTDDTEKKTDMNFVFKKTPGQNYNFVPVQFTISANSGLEKKKTDIENFLFQQLFNKKPVRNNFLLLSVNGAFKQAFSEKGEFSILKEYKEWLDAREEREKTA